MRIFVLLLLFSSFLWSENGLNTFIEELIQNPGTKKEFQAKIEFVFENDLTDPQVSKSVLYFIEKQKNRRYLKIFFRRMIKEKEQCLPILTHMLRLENEEMQRGALEGAYHLWAKEKIQSKDLQSFANEVVQLIANKKMTPDNTLVLSSIIATRTSVESILPILESHMYHSPDKDSVIALALLVGGFPKQGQEMCRNILADQDNNSRLLDALEVFQIPTDFATKELEEILNGSEWYFAQQAFYLLMIDGKNKIIQPFIESQPVAKRNDLLYRLKRKKHFSPVAIQTLTQWLAKPEYAPQVIEILSQVESKTKALRNYFRDNLSKLRKKNLQVAAQNLIDEDLKSIFLGFEQMNSSNQKKFIQVLDFSEEDVALFLLMDIVQQDHELAVAEAASKALLLKSPDTFFELAVDNQKIKELFIRVINRERSPQMPKSMVQQLIDASKKHKKVSDVLATEIHSPKETNRLMAYLGISFYIYNNPQASALFAQSLQDSSAKVRAQGVRLLMAYDPYSSTTKQRILSKLEDPTPEVRRYVAVYISRLLKPISQRISYAQQLLEDGDLVVKIRGAETIIKHQATTPDLEAIILKGLKTKDYDIKIVAADSIVFLGKQGMFAAQELEKVFLNESPHQVLITAIDAISSDSPKVVVKIKALLADPSDSIKLEAAYFILSRIENKSAEEVLINFLDSKDYSLSYQAMSHVSKLGKKATFARAKLEKMRIGTDSYTRMKIDKILENLPEEKTSSE